LTASVSSAVEGTGVNAIGTAGSSQMRWQKLKC
jgi:hypothetical protein